MATNENPSEGVDKEHDQFKIMHPWLTLVDDLRQGTARIREQHDTYLPSFAAEKEQNYQRRWKQATVYPAFEETIGMVVGKAFTNPPILGDDVPPEITGTDTAPGLQENVDLQGNHFQVFAQNFFKQGLRSGLCHILVDATPLPEGATTEETKMLAGHRPYWTIYPAQQVFAWEYEIQGGWPVLTQVRIREMVEETISEFVTKKIDQIRVFQPGLFRIFRKDDDGQWAERKDLGGQMLGYAGAPLTYIPWVTFYADEDNGIMTAIPPLLDLAYQNIRHFNKQSDYDNCMTIACFPIFCATGIAAEETDIVLSPFTVCKSNNDQAKFFFAEHTGAALGAARQDLQDLKQDMAMHGLKMMMPRTGATQTATEAAITESKTTSQLQIAVLRMKDCLELALDYTAQWLGKGPDMGGSIKVDLKAISLALSDVDQVLKAAGAPQKPILDAETAIQVLIDKGWLSEDIDPKEVVQKLQNQVAQTPVAGLAASFLKPQAPPVKVPVGTTVQ